MNAFESNILLGAMSVEDDIDTKSSTTQSRATKPTQERRCKGLATLITLKKKNLREGIHVLVLYSQLHQ